MAQFESKMLLYAVALLAHGFHGTEINSSQLKHKRLISYKDRGVSHGTQGHKCD